MTIVCKKDLGGTLKIPRAFLLPEKRTVNSKSKKLSLCGLKEKMKLSEKLRKNTDTKINVATQCFNTHEIMKPNLTPQHLTVKKFLYMMRTNNEKLFNQTVYNPYKMYINAIRPRLNQTQKIFNTIPVTPNGIKGSRINSKFDKLNQTMINLKRPLTVCHKNRTFSHSISRKSRQQNTLKINLKTIDIENLSLDKIKLKKYAKTPLNEKATAKNLDRFCITCIF